MSFLPYILKPQDAAIQSLFYIYFIFGQLGSLKMIMLIPAFFIINSFGNFFLSL